MPPWFILANFKKTRASRLGDAIPKASPSSSTTYQVISSETIFLFGHIICTLLGASVCFYFLLFYCNKLGRILAFLCGRETRSAFSCEYSCASLIFVEYFLLRYLQCFQLLFCIHFLFRAVSFCSQVVFICVFGWKQKMLHVVDGILEKTCILLQIIVLDNLTLGNCFELSSSSCLSSCIMQLKPINGELPQSQLKFGLHVWYL